MASKKKAKHLKKDPTPLRTAERKAEKEARAGLKIEKKVAAKKEKIEKDKEKFAYGMSGGRPLRIQ